MLNNSYYSLMCSTSANKKQMASKWIENSHSHNKLQPQGGGGGSYFNELFCLAHKLGYLCFDYLLHCDSFMALKQEKITILKQKHTKCDTCDLVALQVLPQSQTCSISVLSTMQNTANHLLFLRFYHPSPLFFVCWISAILTLLQQKVINDWISLPPHPPIFFFILLYGGYTIFFDRHCLWVEFPLSSAGIVWIQRQPSVKRQTRQKIEYLNHYLHQPIYIKVDEIFM